MSDIKPNKNFEPIVKYAMMMSVVAYMAVGYFMSENTNTYDFTSIKSQPVLLIFCTLALILLLLGKKLAALTTPKPSSSPSTRESRLAPLIIELSIYEFSALIGLVLTLVFSSTQFVIAFGLATLLQQVKVSTKN